MDGQGKDGTGVIRVFEAQLQDQNTLHNLSGDHEDAEQMQASEDQQNSVVQVSGTETGNTNVVRDASSVQNVDAPQMQDAQELEKQLPKGGARPKEPRLRCQKYCD